MNQTNNPYANLALLTDLDGTLLMPDKTVSPEDGAAIAEFREQGGLFSVATGRGLQATQQYLGFRFKAARPLRHGVSAEGHPGAAG